MTKLSHKAEDTKKFLLKVPLFAGLSDCALDRLTSACRLVLVRKGSIIYRKEDYSDFLYIIKSGCVMETVFYRASADIIVKIRNDRDYFGEMGMLADASYPNTALALEDTTLIMIPKRYFLEVVWANTCVCRVIILELIERLQNSAQNMVNVMYLDAPGRLASTIVNLATNVQKDVMSVRITQSALASSSGMARQTAAKILSDWRREGIISTERGRINVIDFDRLLDIIVESEIED